MAENKRITEEIAKEGTYLMETLPDGRLAWVVLVRHREDVAGIKEAIIGLKVPSIPST